MRYGVLALAALLLSSCTQELAVNDVTAKQGVLSVTGSAYVAVPRDGQYGSTRYYGSGQKTAQTIAAAFARHLDQAETGVRDEKPGEALARARELGVDYLVLPVILHWEDRATEWSGLQDRLEVKITVIDVQSERNLGSGIISGTSTWWTFGGDHPEDMLAEPINEFVSGLF